MSADLSTPLAEGRRGEILEAALAVFARCGYENGSMREIAAAVGVSEPALYRHFAGKEEIFLALIAAVSERIFTENATVLESLRPESLREQLVEAFTQRRQAISAYGHILRTVLAAAVHNPQFLDAYRTEIALPVQQALRATVVRLDQAYGLDQSDEQTDARVRAVLSMLIGYLLSAVVLADEPEAAIADAAIRVLGYPEA